MDIYVNFTKTTHQIWLCHVTLASNFEYCYLLPNSVLNFRKIYQIWERLAQERKCYKQKTHWGGTPPPSPYRVYISECKSLYSKMQLKFECISNASIVILTIFLYKNKYILNVFKFEIIEARILVSRCLLNMPN